MRNVRRILPLLLLAGACHRITSWPELAERKGCTPQLLASAAPYEPSRMPELAGSYRLVLIDTSHGWLEIERNDGELANEHRLTLWATDSLHRYSRYNDFRKRRDSTDRPLIGILVGYEKAGFTADRPQAQITGLRYDGLSVVFQPEIMLDGASWDLPIQRQGSWGFGGYFQERANVLPGGAHGESLGQRAGFYCALRVE
ncbi:MAG TPA: hypothetical protein VGP25_03160 [Gemmatimonadaceae bacterium]|nr:hypothetical protein [Gemmatimonadaceae bacterium]